MTDRKQNQRADDRRGAAAIEEDGSNVAALNITPTAKSAPFASSKRVTTAAELSFSETLAVMDEATELPPFGFNIAILEQRLERRLGFDVTQSAINECLMSYYNLREWQERYVMTALGTEVEDFPGKGSGNHPPLSPLKEYDLRSDADDSEEDLKNVEGQKGGRSGLGDGASPTRERHSPRSINGNDRNGNSGGVDNCDMESD